MPLGRSEQTVGGRIALIPVNALKLGSFAQFILQIRERLIFWHRIPTSAPLRLVNTVIDNPPPTRATLGFKQTHSLRGRRNTAGVAVKKQSRSDVSLSNDRPQSRQK